MYIYEKIKIFVNRGSNWWKQEVVYKLLKHDKVIRTWEQVISAQYSEVICNKTFNVHIHHGEGTLSDTRVHACAFYGYHKPCAYRNACRNAAPHGRNPIFYPRVITPLGTERSRPISDNAFLRPSNLGRNIKHDSHLHYVLGPLLASHQPSAIVSASNLCRAVFQPIAALLPASLRQVQLNMGTARRGVWDRRSSTTESSTTVNTLFNIYEVE